MSWLSDRTGIHLNLRPLAPIAGAAIGSVIPGLGTAWGAGLGRGLDDLAHGDSVGQSLKEGALAGGTSYLGGKALAQLRSAFSPGSGTGAGAAAAPGEAPIQAAAPVTQAPIAPPADAPIMGEPGWPGASAMSALGGQRPDGGAMSSLGHAFGSIGKFAADHPNAIGQGLQGLGGIAGSSSENRLRNAQAAQLQQQTLMADEQRKRDLARAQAFGPLAQQLMGNLQNIYSSNTYGGGGVAGNPYAPKQP